MSRLLNVGCGTAYHPSWVNIDANPTTPNVQAHDARRGLPFDDGSLDAVYASHVLEHLRPDAGTRLLRECYRVLDRDGIIRLAVPNLEQIARLYLQSLDGALRDDAEAAARYEWTMLELYDQTVRIEPGGEMGIYLRGGIDERQKAFVASRIGDEPFAPAPTVRLSLLRRLARAASSVRRSLAEAAAFLLLGREGSAALREGLFRRGGEVHQWMYDRYSLRCALEQAGFADVRVCVANDSRIANFARYGLEMRDGRERKPDSLYVEAVKPRST